MAGLFTWYSKRNDYRFGVEFCNVGMFYWVNIWFIHCICLDERFRRAVVIDRWVIPWFKLTLGKWCTVPHAPYMAINNSSKIEIPVRLHATNLRLQIFQSVSWSLSNTRTFSDRPCNRNRWIIEDSAIRILSSMLEWDTSHERTGVRFWWN